MSGNVLNRALKSDKSELHYYLNWYGVIAVGQQPYVYLQLLFFCVKGIFCKYGQEEDKGTPKGIS